LAYSNVGLGLYEEAYETFERVQEDFPENFERIQFFVGKKHYNDEFENEMKKSEEILEKFNSHLKKRSKLLYSRPMIMEK